MEQYIIREIKEFINRDYFDGLKELWLEYQSTEFEKPIAWDYIFQKVYIHACLKKQINIIIWLDSLFKQFDEIQQIGIRHTLTYGKYLLNK